MTNNARKIANEIREQSEGFTDVEIAELPPRIRWGDEFLAFPDARKISYLMKFAEGMNHAVDLIQNERNNLGRLVVQKEAQLKQMQPQMDANNKMLADQLGEMNAYKQDVQATIAKLNTRIRELERGDIS